MVHESINCTQLIDCPQCSYAQTQFHWSIYANYNERGEIEAEDGHLKKGAYAQCPKCRELIHIKHFNMRL